jgi:chloramphenicol 3-O-phosphotransferase
LIANETGLGPGVPKTQRESIARALGDVDQTRTWNLLLDVIAQSGRFPPNATSLTNGFVVNGEQRYWVHIAIDRFTGQVIDKQIEVVKE